ncbi:Flagellar motor switch protein FliM [bacterium HR39]|nr:Flagellar motor switch protein FliM [bacterium HR39]
MSGTDGERQEPPSSGGGADQEALARAWAEMAGVEAEAGEDDDPISAFAAEWAEAIGNDVFAADEPGAAGQIGESPERLLSQEEIDSLLGFRDDDRRSDRSGIHILINSNEITYERLPMLEVVFDRLERILTTSLRNFTSENVDISLENITAQRFGDYLNSIPLPAMIVVYRAVEWDNFALLTIDSPLIYAVIDVLLGGRRGSAPLRIEGRPYTTIETRLVERLARLVLQDLSTAFEPVVPVHFHFERIETNPRFAAIVRPGNACVVFKMRIDLEERGGTMEFLFPYATLEPARDLLLQMFLGEKFGRDSIWEAHLTREMKQAEVELQAVLEEFTLPAGQILDLRVGQQLTLTVGPDSPVVLRCGDIPLFTARAGRRRNRMAVRIEDRVPTREEGGDALREEDAA